MHNFKEEQDICIAAEYLPPNLLIPVVVLTQDHKFFDTLPSKKWSLIPLPLSVAGPSCFHLRNQGWKGEK